MVRRRLRWLPARRACRDGSMVPSDPKYESFLPFGGTNSHTVTQFFQCTWMGSAYETVANGRIALVRQAEFSLTTCEIAGVVPLL